ncbi:unnamed protein product [Acanthocheilonema viteae]|uniref:Uncharacterized protein n=1 Tax=Acanthocheilonema viteae TaxID=6277 RepID=A0A498SLL6_ACAVI|nr:unnamed protein product [Acanthocheilonema viteae]
MIPRDEENPVQWIELPVEMLKRTPLEVSLIKKGDGVNLEQLNDTAEKKLKNKCEKEDEDDTLFNVDPLMPDMDLPSLRLNTKTE